MDELIVVGSYKGTGCPAYEVHKVEDKYIILAEYWGNEHHCWLFDDKEVALKCFDLMCDNG